MVSSNQRKLARMQNQTGNTISRSLYNLILGGVIFYGFLANAIIVYLGSDFFIALAQRNYFIFIIGYFVLAFLGSFISFKSQNPLTSFLGYNLVVLPIGALLSVVLPAYNAADILLSIILTGLVVLTITILSSIFPRFFAKIGRTLFLTLIISLLAEVVAMLFGYRGNLFSLIFVVIFSLYIGYDWQKAQMYPKNADNAVDCALDLYLDIINLFIRLLSILGRSRNSN